MSKASKNTGKDDPGRLFAEQLIERMKEINASDWKQGWIDAKSNGGIPQNIDGRRYNGANPFFLMMNTAKNKYTVPVYATFLRISKLNDHLLDENGRIPKDKSDQCVRIKKGEHSIPVLYWSFSIKDKDGHKISMEEYDLLTKEEQDKYTVMPIPRTYSVFNIDQTNLAEVDKERYQAIVDKVKGTSLTDTAGMYANAALDRMFAKQEWVCPIHVDEAQSDCFYRTSEDAIYGPMKGQFKIHNEKEPEELYKDGMEFYSSIVHEMAHSTGTAERLNRQKGGRFGDPKYGKEELVAELTAALVGSTLGFDKRIRDNNTAYVKGWLNALHEEPKFIYTIMSEVGKASDMILAEVEKQEKKIEAEQGKSETQEVKTDEKAEQVKEDKVQAAMQHTDENQRADVHAAKQMPEQQNDTDNEKSIVNLVDGEDSTYYYFFYKFPVLGAKKPSELVGETFFLDDDRQKPLVITGYDKGKDQFTISVKDGEGKDVTKQMSSDNLTDYLFYHFTSEAQNKVNDLAAERMKAQKAVERTMDEKPAINPKELTDAEVKDFREGLQDTVRRMKNEGDSELSINNYLDDLKVKWEDSPAMLSAISDAGKMISEEKKDWYVSVNYLQSSEDTAVFEEFESKDDYKGMLRAARDYDFSSENDWDLQDTFKDSPKHYSGDDIMDEDEDYAIVKNDSVGGTYTIFRRATESEVREEAARQGYGEDKIGDYGSDLSDDVKSLVNQMVDEKQKVVSQSENVKPSQELAGDKIRKQLSANSVQVDLKTAEKSQPEQLEIDKIFSKLTEACSELQRNYYKNEKFFDKTWYGNHLGMDNVNGIVGSLSYEYSFINNGRPEGNEAKAAFIEDFKDAYRYFSELCWIAECNGYGANAAARGFSPSSPHGIMWTKSYNAQRQLDSLNDALGLKLDLNKLYQEGIEKSRADAAKAHVFDNEHPEVESLKYMPETDDSQIQEKLYDVFGMKDGNRETIKTGLTMEASAKFVERNDQRYQRKGYDYLISLPQGEQDINKALPDKGEKIDEPSSRKIPTVQEYLADNKLENGQTVDKLTVFRQGDKSIFYTEVGNLKMSREASKEDLKSFFDRTTPVSDLVAKNFGEQLHLASFYNQFKLVEGVADVNVSKHAADGNWYVQAKLTDGRTTGSHVLSWHDRQSLFTIHAATKEQIAARYLNPEIKKMVAEKPVKEQADIQNVSGNMKDSQNAQNIKKWYWDLPGSVELTIPSADFKNGENELLQAVHNAYGDGISDIDLQDVHYNLPIGSNRKKVENNMTSLLTEDIDGNPLKSYNTLAEDDKFVVVGDTQSENIQAYRKLSEAEVVKALTEYAKKNDINIAPMDKELQELASKMDLQKVRSEQEHNMDIRNSTTKSDKEKQQEIQNTMETKKEQEARQQAAESQKEAQKQKEQSEKQKQAQEQAKEQQQQAQQEKQKESKSDPLHKVANAVAVQSAVLITALEYAKANDGRFLNQEGKSEPQIINSETSLTPYNQAILAMKSDQAGWRTNSYTFMKPAAYAGMPVRKGEKATPANWVQWSYKNTQTGEVIDSKKFKDVPESDRDLYERVHDRKSYPLFNVDQTVMNAKKHEEYINLVTSKGQTLETIRDFKHDDRVKRTEELMARLPHSVVLYKDGDTIKAYGGSAKKLQNILSESKGFNITDIKNESGKKMLVASFPESRLTGNLKAINAKGERISFLENKDLATFIKKPLDKSDVIKTVLQDVNKAAQGSGIKVERVLKETPIEYDAAKDTITYSGISKDDGTLRSVSATLDKANDLYRSLVDAFNSESRLDASHRVNMTPEDAAAHVALVRDMAAGVLMTRHGLPSSLSVDTMNSIDHLINELKENPNKVNLLERGVNTAIEVIDKAKLGREIDYGKIRGEKSALADTNSMNFSIIRNLQSMPDKDSREIVVIRDRTSSKADVILPQGASLEANNELPGISKSRIATALAKEGINDVKFYNARGGLGLQQPNAYFEGKEVTLSKLKQYDLLTKKELDVSSSIAKSNDKAIEKFRPIKDDAGTYVFYIKPENEKGFGIKPSGKDMTEYYNAVRSKDKNAIYAVVDAMSQKYYHMASNHPDLKRDFIMPDTSKVDFAKVKIENATLTRDKADNQVYLQARVNGKFMREPVTKQQWDRMWLADDMQAYKNAVAAVTFVPKLEEKQAQSAEKSQQANVGTSESESVKSAQTEDQSEDKSKEKSETNTLSESTGPSADDSKSAIPEQTENDNDQEEDVEEGVRSGRRL